jgi:transposase
MHRAKRRRASDLFRRGLSRAEVARELGVSRSTAGRWYRALRHGGRAPGRPPRLRPGAALRLHDLLRAGPRAHGCDLDAWNAASVAWLIERHLGIRYHRRHVGRLLRRLGWVLPPIGRHADHAFVRVPLRDPDGNALALHAGPDRNR